MGESSQPAHRHPPGRKRAVIEIRDLLRKSDTYAEHRQWGPGRFALTKALCKQYDYLFEHHPSQPFDPGGKALEFSQALQQAHESLTHRGPIYVQRIEDGDLRRLYDLLSGTTSEPESSAGLGLTIGLVSGPGVDYWTIAYHQRDPHPFTHSALAPRAEESPLEIEPNVGHANLVIVLRQTRQHRHDLPRFSSMAVTRRGLKKWLAYSWAHLAKVMTHEALELYQEGPVLSRRGIEEVLRVGHRYQVALALTPRYPWALANLGEMYRCVANAWIGGIRGLLGADGANANWGFYLRALACYHEAIRLDTEDTASWAYAHFGAAVVNVRGFAAANDKALSTLWALMRYWRDREQSEGTPSIIREWSQGDIDLGASRPPSDEIELCLLRLGRYALRRAQEQKGYYYPWAQDYYGGCMLIESVLKNKRIARQTDEWVDRGGPRPTRDDDEVAVVQLAMLEVLSALYLQPNLMNEVFEPGQLYVNAFFEIALLYHEMKRHHLAWGYARRGMNYLFKFQFMPVDGLIGCTILAAISHKSIEQDQGLRVRLAEHCLLRHGVDEHDPRHASSQRDLDVIREQAATSKPVQRLLEASGHGPAKPALVPRPHALTAAEAMWPVHLDDHDIPAQLVMQKAELCEFIAHAFETYCRPVIDPLFYGEPAINTRVQTSLAMVLSSLGQFVTMLEYQLYDPLKAQCERFAELSRALAERHGEQTPLGQTARELHQTCIALGQACASLGSAREPTAVARTPSPDLEGFHEQLRRAREHRDTKAREQLEAQGERTTAPDGGLVSLVEQVKAVRDNDLALDELDREYQSTEAEIRQGIEEELARHRHALTLEDAAQGPTRSGAMRALDELEPAAYVEHVEKFQALGAKLNECLLAVMSAPERPSDQDLPPIVPIEEPAAMLRCVMLVDSLQRYARRVEGLLGMRMATPTEPGYPTLAGSTTGEPGTRSLRTIDIESLLLGRPSANMFSALEPIDDEDPGR